MYGQPESCHTMKVICHGHHSIYSIKPLTCCLLNFVKVLFRNYERLF